MCTCAHTLSPRSPLLLEKACNPLPARSADWLDGPFFGVLLYAKSQISELLAVAFSAPEPPCDPERRQLRVLPSSTPPTEPLCWPRQARP